MVTANIPWDDGSGQNMSVEWDGTENGEITISSPTNPSLSSSRNKTIQVRTTAGSPQITRTINVVQEAAVYTYEYEIQPSSSAVIAASGGTISYTATLKIYLQGSLLKTESVTPTCRIISGTGFSALSNAVTAANRGTEYSTSQRSAQVAVEFVTAETGETLSETVTVTQAANNRVIVYGKPTITSFEVADIPASGGSVSSGSVEYSQSRHYYYDSGDTEELSPLTSGGQVTFGDPVTAESLGTTVKSRTIVGQLTCQVAMNGQISVEGDAPVYQQANTATYGDVSLTVTSPVSVEATGGTFDIVPRASQTVSFTSGATRAGSVSLSYSQVAPVEGFVLDGSQVTVSNNTTTEERSYTVRVTAEGEGDLSTTKSVVFNQVVGGRTYSDITITEFTYPQISAAGGTVTPTLSYSQTWGWNGSTTGGGTITSGASITYSGTSVSTSDGAVTAETKGTTVSDITTVTTATVSVSLNGKSASKQVAVQQAANAITSYGNVTISGGTVSDIPASGGLVSSADGVSASQTVTYTSGATRSGEVSISYGSAVEAESLGTTIKGRSPVGSLSVTATGEGSKSSTKSLTVYQEANVQTDEGISYGAWQISVSANRYTTSANACPASGGTCSITRSATRTRTQNYSYTSGVTSTEALSSETGTPTLSISGLGALLSGTTVRWENRLTTAGAARQATITATMGDESATEVVYQQANEATLTTSVYAMADSVPSEGSSSDLSSNFSLLILMPFKIEWSSGSDYEYNMMSPTLQPVPDYVKSLFSLEIGQTSYVGPDWNLIDSIGVSLCVEVSENTGSSERPVSGALHFNGANSQDFSFDINQEAGSYLNVSPTSLSFEAAGGTKQITIDTNESWTIE